MKAYVFGEILFDLYPDQVVIGGAPFNFCAHLAKLGHETVFLSAVGRDALGKQAVDIAKGYGIDTSKMQTNVHPTGVCYVTLDEKGIPQYDLKSNVAYDHIRLSEQDFTDIAAQDRKLLYFGTLALRQEVSRNTLKTLLQTVSFDEVLYDINIRPPFFEKESVVFGLSRCSILKFSREEAGVFRTFGITDTDDLLPLCKQLTAKFPNIRTVLLTLDRDGALVYDAKSDHFTPSAVPKCEVVSTVGAGDAFFAGYMHGSLNGKTVRQSLQNAIDLSSYVVSHTEAIPAYSDAIIQKMA